MTNKLTMTLAGAARYLNVRRATLVSYVSRGDLCAMLIDSRYLFHQPHLDSFVKEQAEKQAAAIRRAREAAAAAELRERPVPLVVVQPKIGDAELGPALSQNESLPAPAPANPATVLTGAQPDLPGLEPDSLNRKEP